MQEESLEEKTIQIKVTDLKLIEDHMSEWFRTAEHYTKHNMNRKQQFAVAEKEYGAALERIRDIYQSHLSEGERKEFHVCLQGVGY